MKNLNPVVKFIIMFVIGAAAMLLATWLAAFLRNRPLEINWIYILGMGVIIALLDLFIPASKRKENRDKLMDRCELPTTCSREVGASYRKDTLSCCATPLGAVRWRFSLTPVSLPVFIYIIILSYVTVCYYTAMLSFSFVGHCQLQRPWPWQPHLLPSTSGKKG